VYQHKHSQKEQRTPHEQLAAFMCVYMYRAYVYIYTPKLTQTQVIIARENHERLAAFMCVYVYVCITYTCTYIYVCICICMYCIYVYIYTPLLTQTHRQGEQETPHTLLDAFMCVRVHTCITYMYTSYIYLHVCIHLRTHYRHKNTGKKTSLTSFWCIHVCTCTHKYAYIYTPKLIQTYARKARDTSQADRCIHVCKCNIFITYINIYTPLLTHKHRKGEIPHKRLDAFMCVHVQIRMHTSMHQYWHKNTGKESTRHLTSGSMHSCVYMYIHLLHICIHLHTITDTQTQPRRARDTLQRIDPFMRVHVHTCIAYMYTSTHHYWHNNTGTERPLTSGLMHSCVYMYMYKYVSIHLRTNTDTKTQAKTATPHEESLGSMCVYVYVYILTRKHTILIYACICIRIYSHT